MVAAVGARMSVDTIDFDAAYAQFKADVAKERHQRLAPPLVRIWDGNWALRGRVNNIISAEITEVNNDVGMANIELPLDYWISEWVVNLDKRTTSNIHLTVDKDNIRWSGRLDSFTVRKNEDGTGVLAMAFRHDYAELLHIICYPNPFLPPEVQFPKLWFCLSGETRILVRENGLPALRAIKDLAGRPCEVLVDGKAHRSETGSWRTGVQGVYDLVTESGKTLRLTADHRVLTPNGWVQAQNIGVGGELVTDHGLTERVVSFTYAGEEDVYDMAVEDAHRFVAEGITVHNCFGPAKWALKLTAHLNIMRLNGQWWDLGADPLDPAYWPTEGRSTWSMVVKPDAIGSDNSMPALVISRMKSLHDASKKIVADAQLTWTFRRFLPGDPEPWPGANLRYGCLVIDLEDRSGFTTGTSFFGDLFGGLVRAFANIGKDGLQEGIDIINDPSIPPEYYDPTFKGTLPAAPWVIYRDGPHTGIQTSEFTVKPATATNVIAGGHSPAGVNELIGAAVQTVGDLIAAAVFIPPVGGALDRLLAPLYTDVLFSFGRWGFADRKAKAGWSHYHEHFQEGADKAYSLGWLLAMRAGQWATRETTSHEVVVADGAPFHIGGKGFGHFYLGDRVGSTVRGMAPGRVFVDRVSQVSLAWNREQAPGWRITIGQRDLQDPVLKAWEQLREIISLIQDLGVI
ncbi:Hint domain-containing protein [Nocardia sp. CA-128927]|uniref:Hint domain-containing protein n=1 Tax=Nocardia sp. CA-128927 TaxID=3239975 RepID=UPI003D95D0B7